MRVTGSKDKGFTPFGLNIVFQSQMEVDQFYNIFNHAFIVDELCPVLDDEGIRESIETTNSAAGNEPINNSVSDIDQQLKDYKG